MWRNWNSYALPVGIENSVVAEKDSIDKFLKKLNTELPHDSAITFLGIYSRTESRNSNSYLYTNVQSSTVHSGQNAEIIQMSIN